MKTSYYSLLCLWFITLWLSLSILDMSVMMPIYESNQVYVTRHIKWQGEAKITCYNDEGITASGLYTREGIVATSDRSIPMMTTVKIEGYGEMLVADKTARWIYDTKGLVFDLYMPVSDEECLRFGVRRAKYLII